MYDKEYHNKARISMTPNNRANMMFYNKLANAGVLYLAKGTKINGQGDRTKIDDCSYQSHRLEHSTTLI
jgi:hypothetical protein